MICNNCGESTLGSKRRDSLLNNPATDHFELIAELFDMRLRQDTQWGGAEHDDEHDISEWLAFITKQTGYGHRAVALNDLEGLRSRYVKIAALAMAAIQSFDRKVIL